VDGYLENDGNAAHKIIPVLRLAPANREKKGLSPIVVHHRDVRLDDELPLQDIEEPVLDSELSSGNYAPPLSPPAPGADEGVCPLMTPSCKVLSASFQLLALSGTHIPVHVEPKGIVMPSWDFLTDENSSKLLCDGLALFRFLCRPCTKLNEDDKAMTRKLINISIFHDEVAENNVPSIDVDDVSSMAKYTAVYVKANYILPGIAVTDITADLLGSLEYHKSCQPGKPKFSEDVTEKNTIRFAKIIVKFIWTLNIQLKIWEIPAERMQEFRDIDGLVPSKVIVMERTKRNKANIDSTRKCKSFLFFYPVTDGVLMSHITLTLNSAIPNFIAAIMNNFGGQGCKEAAETAFMTRRYLIAKFGDRRLNRSPQR